MNIVGVQAFYYGQAAALLSGGRLEFFCEEEKLNRIKGQREGFPIQGLRTALEYKGITLADVDEIAFPIDSRRYAWTLLRSGLAAMAHPSLRGNRKGHEAVSLIAHRISSTLPFIPPMLDSLIRHNIRYGGIQGRIPPIRQIAHHRSHAASAFFTSGMEEAAIVIIDGMGETESTSIWHGRGKELHKLESIAFPNSLGEFYAAFTEYCGFKTYQQEAKLMGLAAYGRLDSEVSAGMDRVIRIRPEQYKVARRYTIGGIHSFGVSYSDALVDLFGLPRRPEEEILERHKNIAFAAQDRLESAVLEIVKRAVRLTGCRNLSFSGGVAMNCKVNGRILQSDMVDELYVLPASNDAGVALGAAMVRSMATGDDPRCSLEHVYYGPTYSEKEIEAVLRNSKAAYRRLNSNGFDEVAALLTDKKVVGLYTGRSEFGARALGARSILADPRFPEMATIVNQSVKHRETWRPFAPVILDGHENEYFVGGRRSRYMMKAFEVRPEKRHLIPAVTHIDGTCRPQSIARDQNPTYHGILSAFHAATGVPLLLNTSFNIRGEPIVCRPVEALRCYLSTGMDAVVMGPFLLRKESPDGGR